MRTDSAPRCALFPVPRIWGFRSSQHASCVLSRVSMPRALACRRVAGSKMSRQCKHSRSWLACGNKWTAQLPSCARSQQRPLLSKLPPTTSSSTCRVSCRVVKQTGRLVYRLQSSLQRTQGGQCSKPLQALPGCSRPCLHLRLANKASRSHLACIVCTAFCFLTCWTYLSTPARHPHAAPIWFLLACTGWLYKVPGCLY